MYNNEYSIFCKKRCKGSIFCAHSQIKCTKTIVMCTIWLFCAKKMINPQRILTTDTSAFENSLGSASPLMAFITPCSLLTLQPCTSIRRASSCLACKRVWTSSARVMERPSRWWRNNIISHKQKSGETLWFARFLFILSTQTGQFCLCTFVQIQRDSRRFFRGRTAFPGKRVNVKSVSRVRISLSLLLKDWFSIDYNPKNIFFVRH